MGVKPARRTSHEQIRGRGRVEVEVDVVNHIIFSTHVARGYVGFGAEDPGRRSPGFTSPYGVRPVTGPAQVSRRASNVTAWGGVT